MCLKFVIFFLRS